MKVAIAAGGRFHALHLANQLNKHGHLKRLYTNSYTNNDFNYVPKELVSNNRFLQFIDPLYFKLRLSYFVSPSSWYVFKDRLFDNWLNKELSNLESTDIFVGWANYFLNSLPRIKQTGAKVVLESGSTHILYMQKMLQQEYSKFGLKSLPLSDANISKMLEEYAAADRIMVPSDFVRNSFIQEGINPSKIIKVPYGVNLKRFVSERVITHKKFRVIFVGLVGLRKGVKYLLDAWKALCLADAELLIVGNIEKNFYEVLKNEQIPGNVKFLGAVSQDKLIKFYQESSLFVLPSLEEGLAMVQAEAMASGLPILCSTNTGGSELIENNKEGFIVPIRDVLALQEKILWCYENRLKCFEMGLRAQEKVKQFTWENYGQNIIESYRSLL